MPCLIAVEKDYSGNARKMVLAWARASAGPGRHPGDHLQDRDRDRLFGEQVVLCGGVTELVKAGFETLVEAGTRRRSASSSACTSSS